MIVKIDQYTAVWLHWFEAFLKARQQAQNYNGEIGLHVKSKINMLHLREGKGFLICLLDSKYFAQKLAKNSVWTPR